MSVQPLAWCDPLRLAHALGTGPMVLLHSSVQASYSGRLSLLATRLLASVDVASFDDITPLLSRQASRFEPCWFGYLGYEMRHDCEDYTPAARHGYRLPRGRLMRFADIYVFDHDARTLHCYSDRPVTLPPLPALPENEPAPVSYLSSNMTRAAYEARVATIIEAIEHGSLYQANLTRKFYGAWQEKPDGLALFARLCRLSPAPYSAYLRMEDAEVLSSSPELFLKIEADGRVSTRPIKGSAPRGNTPQEDDALRQQLQHSVKNRAENLMITDLMRHDLARSCVAGSITVGDLFEVTPHATIFHMASTVSGQLKPDCPISEVLRGSFPPGSMTGAPKISAVEWCNRLEDDARGIYSGAIGWFGGDGAAELSVVIRTLILRGNEFEFQVGGGIVADSTPAGEWQETMDKALGILKTLGIERARLESL